MSGGKQLPSNDEQLFNAGTAEDESSDINEANSRRDSKNGNQTYHNDILCNQCNQESSAENFKKKDTHETTLKYPKLKTKILLAWKEDQDKRYAANIEKLQATDGNEMECVDSNFLSISTIGQDKNKNTNNFGPPKSTTEFNEESTDSEIDNIFDDNLAVSGPSHFTHDVCKQVYDYQSVLEDHYDSHFVEKSSEVYTTKRPTSFHCIYKGNICLKQFISAENLQMHYKTNNCETLYVCNKCGMSLSDPGHFNTHRDNCGFSNAVGKYICNWCNKTFKTKQQRIIHHRIHSGEKPYECMTCKICFSDPSNFRKHFKSCGVPKYTREKPYECKKCGKRFSDSSNCRRHRKKCGFLKQGSTT